MSLRQILIIIAIGSGILISTNSINSLYFAQISWPLITGVVSGPILAIVFLPKNYWLRVNALIITFAGLAGLTQLISVFGEFYFLGVELKYPVNLYIYQGILSLLLIVTAIIWYVFDKRGKYRTSKKGSH